MQSKNSIKLNAFVPEKAKKHFYEEVEKISSISKTQTKHYFHQNLIVICKLINKYMHVYLLVFHINMKIILKNDKKCLSSFLKHFFSFSFCLSA